MPTYDYFCPKCNETFEVFQSMKDPHLTTCIREGCDGEVKRQIGTGAGLIFKGSGFYITDYRSENYKAAAKKDGTAPAAAAPAAAAPAPAPAAGGGAKPAPAPSSSAPA